MGQKRLDDAILVTEAAVRLEDQERPRPAPRAHIHEDGSHKRFIESQESPPKLLTQLGSLLEQLNRMRMKKS
jgi:hypothetical protein